MMPIPTRGHVEVRGWAQVRLVRARLLSQPCAQTALNLQRRIEGIDAGQRRLREHAAGKGHQCIRAGEVAGDREARHFDRVQREYVAMDELVVPRWTWSVVAEVVAAHILVGGEPAGIVVEALAGAARFGGAPPSPRGVCPL